MTVAHRIKLHMLCSKYFRQGPTKKNTINNPNSNYNSPDLLNFTFQWPEKEKFVQLGFPPIIEIYNTIQKGLTNAIAEKRHTEKNALFCTSIELWINDITLGRNGTYYYGQCGNKKERKLK